MTSRQKNFYFNFFPSSDLDLLFTKPLSLLSFCNGYLRSKFSPKMFRAVVNADVTA